jgi:phosphoglycolate phosphatase-like HAD superfamily hydrolase
MSSKPLILFDLVATLTDAGPRYARAYINMCRAWDMTPPAEDEILEALGEMNLKQIIAKFTPALPAEHIVKFMSDCNNACDAILDSKGWQEQLFPQVRKTLIALHDNCYTLGIYTGTRENGMRAQLAYHDIAYLFDPAFVRAKDNVRDGDRKSAELKAAQIRDMAATHGGPVIVIGDSPSDFAAARAAGAAFIGFVTTPGRAQSLRDAGAAALFTDFAQLPALIEQATRAAAPNQTRPASPGLRR